MARVLKPDAVVATESKNRLGRGNLGRQKINEPNGSHLVYLLVRDVKNGKIVPKVNIMHALISESVPPSEDLAKSPDDSEDLEPIEFCAWVRTLRRKPLSTDDYIYRRVYGRLMVIARYVGQNAAGRPTGGSLVNRFYNKYVEDENLGNGDKHRFFCLAASMLREIFVSSAKHKILLRSDGAAVNVRSPEQLIEIDRLVDSLQRDDPNTAQIFVQHHFACLSVDEIAGAMDLSAADIQRNLRFANAYILRRIS
ncbi:MAG: ECF-type sigma factor [Gammaproteobacteria bacterium]